MFESFEFGDLENDQHRVVIVVGSKEWRDVAVQFDRPLESTRAHYFEIRLRSNGEFNSPFKTSSLSLYHADRLFSKDKNYSSDFPEHFAGFVVAALNQGQARLGRFESNRVILQEEVDNQQLVCFCSYEAGFPSSSGTRTVSSRGKR